jgi:hypothetical protein
VGVRREHFALHPAVQDRDISDYECKRGGSPSMRLREAANPELLRLPPDITSALEPSPEASPELTELPASTAPVRME